MKRPETLEELAARWGCSIETAKMFQRQPRKKTGPKLAEPRGASAKIAALAGPESPAIDQSAELLALMVRVGELEGQVLTLRAEATRRFRVSSAATLSRARPRRSVAFRGGARVRDLRHSLRLARLMLARQGRGGLKLNRLAPIGSREQLRERLAELPSVGNPYVSIPGKGDR